MKKILAFLLAFMMSVPAAFLPGTVQADPSAIQVTEISSPVSIHTDLQKEVLEAGYKNIKDYFYLVREESAERGQPNGVTVSWTYDAAELPETFHVCVSLNEDMSDAAVYEAVPVEIDGLYQFTIQNVFINATYYYTISDGTEVSDIHSFLVEDVCPRNLRVDGITNVRDLGGWKTEDGKMVRQGLFFRGGQLNVPKTNEPAITPEGIHTMLEDLHIRTEVDVREDYEIGEMTETPLGDAVQYINIPLTNENMSQEGVKEFFQLLTDKDNYPIYLHCKGGVGRTGFLCYLILGLLNVPEDSIYTDYVFSNLARTDLHGERDVKRLEKVLKQNFETKKLTETPNYYTREYLLKIGMTEEELDQIVNIMLGK